MDALFFLTKWYNVEKGLTKMAKKSGTMEFKRGDTQYHYFQVPETVWVAGGTLWFAAKPSPDNDNTDGAAVINKSFDDTNIVNNTHEMYLQGYATYELKFEPADIVGVTFATGEKVKKYVGEFQIVSALGEPESYPNNDEYIEVLIYADVKRGVA